MSTISILELRPSGSNLFDDPETFLNELTDQDSKYVIGGLAISQVTVSGGIGVFNPNFQANGIPLASNENAFFVAGLMSDMNNAGFSYSIKTYVV
jgi:hypothetical protein